MIVLNDDMNIFLAFLPKLLVSTVCGALIGYERELKNKAAGIRTYTIICVGSMLFTSLANLVDGNVDKTRIIGQIVTGVGFLGAGVIFKQNNKMIGVTTAAFIWYIAAIGSLIGCGYFISPLFMTIGLIIISYILAYIEKKINKN